MMERFPSVQDSAAKREDNRGWLQVLYESESMVLKRSFSKAGVFRGLHVQMPPSPQVKLIRVVSGRIIDVIVSMDDPARVIHHKALTAAHDWVQIDAHYAHGFYAVEDTIFEYVCDGGYDEPAELAFSVTDWLRDTLGLVNPTLSAKDLASQPLIAG
jgi:dTDP-4-dehydrorhamnose 3,5-epimerase